MPRSIFIVAIGLLITEAAPALSVPALNFDHTDPVAGSVFERGSVWDFNPGSTHGYGFEILEPVEVRKIGVYDDNADGIQGDYRVGVWEGLLEDGPQLIDVTIAGGEAANLDGSWRTDAVTPITLQPGRYTIGMVPVGRFGLPLDPPAAEVDQYYLLTEPGAPGDPRDLSNDGRFELFPQFETFIPLFSTATGFGQPDSRLLVSGGFVGATIFITIPEPATALTLAVASSSFAVRRRR